MVAWWRASPARNACRAAWHAAIALFYFQNYFSEKYFPKLTFTNELFRARFIFRMNYFQTSYFQISYILAKHFIHTIQTVVERKGSFWSPDSS